MPARFVREAFKIERPKNILIEDEGGRKFNCSVSKRNRRVSEANTGKEWNNFCSTNKLKENSKIEIEVHPNCSSKAFVKIIGG